MVSYEQRLMTRVVNALACAGVPVRYAIAAASLDGYVRVESEVRGMPLYAIKNVGEASYGLLARAAHDRNLRRRLYYRSRRHWSGRSVW